MAACHKETMGHICLATAISLPGAEVRLNRVCDLEVPARQAATMFYLNLPAIRQRPFARDNYPAEAMDRLESGLKALSELPGDEQPVKWRLRQIVVAKGEKT